MVDLLKELSTDLLNSAVLIDEAIDKHGVDWARKMPEPGPNLRKMHEACHGLIDFIKVMAEVERESMTHRRIELPFLVGGQPVVIDLTGLFED